MNVIFNFKITLGQNILLHPGHHLFLPGFCSPLLIGFPYRNPASLQSVLCSAAGVMFLKGNVIMLLPTTPILHMYRSGFNQRENH